jgi:hypothetical protein
MFDVFYTGTPPKLFPHEQQVDSIEQAQQQSRTRYFWWINYLSDYSAFDFLWEPVPWESDQMHVWPSQHQSNGGTALVPREYDHVNRSHSVVPRRIGAPRLHIKHTPTSEDLGDANVRYVSDYLGTMRRALSKTKWEYCWVTSDVCDYTDFDFSWHPSEWQLDMLHVFASNEQKFGDTFYVHVPSFLEKTKSLKVLEWFETLNFVEDRSVPRLPMPQVQYTDDSLATAVWKHEFSTPLVEFYQTISMDNHAPTVSLWQECTKTVVPLSRGHATAVVPRECKNYIKTQIYDYPHIDKTQIMLKEQPLDIVFISNGENEADWLYQNLMDNVGGNSLVNGNYRIKRVQNVNGRVAAYHAAARASTTPWFFAVFGKLMVDPKFDWSWQPDRMQQAKHYIFHARNPVNELVYGHQAMIAYNKKLVLENAGVGLDFTLDQPHEVVPIVSGTANYQSSNWTCWRTAFREVLKLRASLPDVENEYRLNRWLVKDNTPGQWSIKGAQDAMEYYQAVEGDSTELRKSYEWAWLASYALIKRNLTTDQ